VANLFTITLGKLIQRAARLKGGGGSAFPGRVVEALEPDFAVRVLERLPRGVVVISGTNGKTTTTKIVTELLQAQGLRVFTNSSGSNFMRGVISSLLSQMTLGGRLDADIAVLELDEAHAVHFVRKVAPRYALLLNVMRDQLDRFGEIDHTADLLAVIARHTTEAVVVNREDNRLARFAERDELCESTARLYWYGLAPELRPRFPQDDELYAEELDASVATTNPAPATQQSAPAKPEALVTLNALENNAATYTIDGIAYPVELKLKGIYNVYNAAAALALVHVISLSSPAPPVPPASPVSPPPPVPPASPLSFPAKGRESLAAQQPSPPQEHAQRATHTLNAQLVANLATIESAFGRGESFTIGNRELEMLLVKNPGGFRLALESFQPQGFSTMIAINDEYADGRDMSWLFDVDFSALAATGVAMVSGTRAWDMALRLRYDEVPFETVDTQLEQALDNFIAGSELPLRVYCTYTAMLRCRAHLARYTSVSKVG
jgi:UDP-N-acetylmuramyl tripeptide synthase